MSTRKMLKNCLKEDDLKSSVNSSKGFSPGNETAGPK